MNTRLIKTNEEIKKIELLRGEVFNIKELGGFYLDNLLNKTEYALGTFDNNIIVGGIYFHRFDTILMIDQVFVKKEYQNQGIGTNLIKTLLNSKADLEQLLGSELTMCNIDSRDKKSHDIYSNIGFRESKRDTDTLYKRL